MAKSSKPAPKIPANGQSKGKAQGTIHTPSCVGKVGRK